MDLGSYVQRKQSGVVSIVKIGENFVLVHKQFAPNTGEPLPDALEPTNMNFLLNLKSQLEKGLEGANALILDCQGVK